MLMWTHKDSCCLTDVHALIAIHPPINDILNTYMPRHTYANTLKDSADESQMFTRGVAPSYKKLTAVIIRYYFRW
jgi:hypothetical protein